MSEAYLVTCYTDDTQRRLSIRTTSHPKIQRFFGHLDGIMSYTLLAGRRNRGHPVVRPPTRCRSTHHRVLACDRQDEVTSRLLENSPWAARFRMDICTSRRLCRMIAGGRNNCQLLTMLRRINVRLHLPVAAPSLFIPTFEVRCFLPSLGSFFLLPVFKRSREALFPRPSLFLPHRACTNMNCRAGLRVPFLDSFTSQ